MRNILLAAGFVGLFGLLQACGETKRPPSITGGGSTATMTGGRTTGGSKNDVTDAGQSGGGTSSTGDGGGPSNGTLAPTVTITAPAPTSDPNAESVLTGNSVQVVCTVEASNEDGAQPVDTSSVKVAILDADGKVVEEKNAAPTGNLNEYSNDFNLKMIAAGVVGFRCSAASQDDSKNSTEIETLVDQGPTITFLKPIADAPQALAKPLDIEFTVAAAPIADGDDGAQVDTVALSIIGHEIDLSKAMDAPGHYHLQVNLANTAVFMPTPTGPTGLKVTATNKRKPTAVTAVNTESVNVDGDGPTIKISDPLDKAFVKGKVTLKFTVGDGVSGVDPNTVVISLNDEPHPYDANDTNWTFSKDAFTFKFDIRDVKAAIVQFTLNINAKDMVGNVAQPASELLYLDEYPPVMDLDPLPIRTITDTNDCSRSFDPVGDNATNDLDKATVSGFFRAVVWDETNRDPDGKIKPHFSGTDQASVRLYLSDDSTSLLINNDDDPECDDVIDVDSAKSLVLSPVSKVGQPWYEADGALAPSSASLACNVKVVPKPDQLCVDKESDMWQVIQDEYNGLPVIYASSPTAGHECTGVGWEFTTKVNKDGWVCFATRSVDRAGNVGISRPIRVCTDVGTIAGTPACANSSTTPPDCTDGCTPPARWGNTGVRWK